MQNQRRGAPSRSGTTKIKAPAMVRETDPNKGRLVFVLTSLIGQRVTAKLRDNVVYEGIFDSFSTDNDYAIVLKSARKLASDAAKTLSGKVMASLVIPGNDFLTVQALDVSSASVEDKEEKTKGRAGFKTDTEVSHKSGVGGERDLATWAGEGGGEGGEVIGSGGNVGTWNQFEANEQMFGVSTTFDEDIYTTPLDPSLIPREKREEADRIAREIENGTVHVEQESELEGEDDEEGRYSAVQGTGAYKKNDGNGDAVGATISAAASAKAEGVNRQAVPRAQAAPLSQIPQMPEPRQDPDALDKRKGGASPAMMKTSMIQTEMKRINALNLEPAMPKLEGKAARESMEQNRQSKASGGNSLKMEFQQSLALIKSRHASKQEQQAEMQQQESHENSSSENWRGGGKGSSQLAKDFTFNPGAISFTPTGNTPTDGNTIPQRQPTGMAANAQGAPLSAASKQIGYNSPPFKTFDAHPASLSMKLDDIMDFVFNSSKSEVLSKLEPNWAEAQGPSFHEVLGRPNPSNQLPLVGNMGGQPLGGPQWQLPQQQQQQQQKQQQPPQQPMGQAPPGPPMQRGQQGGPQMMPQMIGQQMMAPGVQMPPAVHPQGQYQSQAGGQLPAHRPQNNNNMLPQDQQPMGFNQQNMMQPQPGPQGMAVPSGMVNPQCGPNQGGFAMQPMPGGAMPKFGQQQVMMMVAPAQYPQQFQPGPQPAGPPGGPQQGHLQQTHMMPVQMMQGGPRGPMGGHEG